MFSYNKQFLYALIHFPSLTIFTWTTKSSYGEHFSNVSWCSFYPQFTVNSTSSKMFSKAKVIYWPLGNLLVHEVSTYQTMPVGHPVLQWQDQSQLVLLLLLLPYLLITNFQAENERKQCYFSQRWTTLFSNFLSFNWMVSLWYTLHKEA